MTKKRKKATNSKITKIPKKNTEKVDSAKKELEIPKPEIESKEDKKVEQKEVELPEEANSKKEPEEKPVPVEKKPVSIPEEGDEIIPEEKKDDKGDKKELIQEVIGNLELSILKDLNEKNKKDYNQEVADNVAIEERFKWIKQLADQLPDSTKKFENDFQQIIEKNKKECSTDGISDDLKVKLDNRQESIDLCLKMITNLSRFFPQLETLKEKVTKVSELKNYEWADDTKFKDITMEEFEKQKTQLGKEIESFRNNNYHVIRQKRESVEQFKKFFFDFFNRHFFSIIDGLDRGRTFFKENKNEWVEKYPDFKELIEARYLIYDSLLEVTFNFLKNFYIHEIPVKEGEEFNELIHEPFMVEEDPAMEPNKIIIKEINSRGFKFINPDVAEELTIRSPQVIVVKK